MQRLLALVVFLFSASAFAQTGPKEQCVSLGTLVNAQAMSSSRSFSVDRSDGSGGYGVVTLFLKLTDANTSITSFRMSCTGSEDGNTTDYTIQTCDVSAGDCTSSDATWTKASPGTKNWPWRVVVDGLPDFECTFSVAAGSGAAADLLTVTGRLCTK